MKITAVSVTSHDMKKSVAFYTLLGFSFPAVSENEQHVEPEPKDGSARLMIDSAALVGDMLGAEPRSGNHSSFAIEYDTPDEVDKIAGHVKKAGHTIVKEPWDAFWGQRYAVVQDPDGYMVDLYAYLKTS